MTQSDFPPPVIRKKGEGAATQNSHSPSPNGAHPKLHLSAKQAGTGNSKEMVSPQSKHIFNFLETIISLGHDQTLPPDVPPKRLLVREAQTHTKREHCWEPAARSHSQVARAIAATEACAGSPAPALGAGSPAPPRGCSPPAPAPTTAIRWNCASHPGSSALRATFLRSPSPRTPRRAPGGQQRGAVAAGQESSADSSLFLSALAAARPGPRANRTRAHRTRRSPAPARPGRGRHGHR